ncbi:putative l-lactate dehydrogenase protein [Neofusicoccum parvum UCRNP2]|uniref:Putative l-lactate dehydrogenase protein n=1 Tax=Botryosphaeria parva (strain UCR-NP2) TaxID=1287680 RepID=R1GTE7_BOTPV|nr:putative l-lactate dehydrogenase protein [Neofusicoccum parvum UCRNP2]
MAYTIKLRVKESRENFWASNEEKVPVLDTGQPQAGEELPSAIGFSKFQADEFVPPDPGKLKELAKNKLTQGGWYYASSNARQSYTHTANRRAFYRYRIVPRMLVDTNTRDTQVEIFGHKVSAPIGNYAFYQGIGADLGLGDPIHQKRLAEDGIHPEKQPNEAGAKWIDKVWHGRVHSWEKMPWLMKTWKEISGRKPFGIKSI